MPSFVGFPSGKVHMTPIPEPFFSELLPEINDLGEMKVTLYAIWFLDHLEAPVRYLTYADFAEDERLCKGMGGENLSDALERATQRGTLLTVQMENSGRGG